VIDTVTSVLRVVLADDNFLVREGVAALLGEAPAVEVVAAVGDADELLAAVERHTPDAVLTDIRMPPSFTTEGIDAARRIRAAHPSVGVVVLSQFIEADWCLTLLGDGSAGLGYLLKDRVTDLDELTDALHVVARGGSVLDPRVLDGLLSRRMADDEGSAMPALTARELEVLELMAAGRSNAAISSRLFMSERSVEKHISSTFVKLGLAEESETNRRVAAVLAYLDARPHDGRARANRP
jgi:DNA-binding NarL/FixJ family response regulator